MGLKIWVGPVEALDKMKLYEMFEDPDDGDPLRVATTATLAQIKSEIEDTNFKGKFTVNTLLAKLRDNGVKITKDQLIELVSEEPWSNLISNVNSDTVEFKDEESDVEVDDSDFEDDQYNLEQMSKRAAKKPSGL
jgi:hypothetical protein